MALIKTKTLANGAIGDYWKITAFTYNRTSHFATIEISLFKDNSFGAAAAHPLLSKSYKLTIAPGELNTNPISVLYTKILARAETTISINELGRNITPRPFDSDLDGAING